MKNKYILFGLLAIAFNAGAQNISRKVISSAGGTLSGGNNQVTFTIGETVIPSLSAGGNIITQGFQQPGEAIKTGAVITSACVGSSIAVPFTSSDIGGGNIYTAQLSDATGSFASAVNIGTLSGNASSGTISAVIPMGTLPGSAYRIRVASSSPLKNGQDNGINIQINPLPATSITGTAIFCAGSSTVLNAGAGFSAYLWDNASTSLTRNVAAAGTYTVTVTNANGCTGSASKTITISNAAPPQPGLITGPNAVCLNSNVPYSVAAVIGATSYSWTATSGASVSTGQGSTNVVINFSGSATNANISVVANNVCGSGIARTLAYAVSSVPPSTPSTITGSFYGVCGQTNVAYNCPASANALSYLWTVPSGAIILGGQGTNAISVKYSGAFTGSGIITVTAQNGCGSSLTTSRTVNSKAQQPVISGSNWACKNQPGLVYTVAAITGASNYTWTVVPGSTLVSGQGSTSIVVNWGGINGVIKCTANNACGSSLPASKPVSFTCREVGSSEEFSELSLYPNPASTSATISFEGFAEGKGHLAVYDLIGQQVLNTDLAIVSGNNNYKLDLSNIAKGAYTVKVIYNGFERNCKLIVQ